MKMTTVIAKGLINGKTMTIVCTGTNDNLTVTFNGEKDEHLLEWLNMGIQMAPPLGNNFYYDKPSIAAYYHVLNTVCFDRLDSIEVEGEIEPIPCEDGLIY